MTSKTPSRVAEDVDKKIASEKLLEAVKIVKINENKVVGSYRGMELEVSYNFLTNEHNFSLNGATKHYGMVSLEQALMVILQDLIM